MVTDYYRERIQIKISLGKESLGEESDVVCPLSSFCGVRVCYPGILCMTLHANIAHRGSHHCDLCCSEFLLGLYHIGLLN